MWRLLAVASSTADPGLPSLDSRTSAGRLVACCSSSSRRCSAATRPRSHGRPPTRSSSSLRPSRSGQSADLSPIRSFLDRRQALRERIGAIRIEPDPGRATDQRVDRRRRLGRRRNTYLTDTMIVVSLDPVTQTVSMSLDPARHGRRPAVGRTQVSGARSTGSCRTRGVTRSSSGLGRHRVRCPEGRARHAPESRRSSTTRRSTSADSSASSTPSVGSTCNVAAELRDTNYGTATTGASRSRPAATT